MRTRYSIKGSLIILQLALALYFILLGYFSFQAYGFDGNYFVGLRSDNVIMFVSGCITAVCGLILVGGLFNLSRKGAVSIAAIVVFVLWLVRIVYFRFINGSYAAGISSWLMELTVDVIILISIWIVSKKNLQ